MHIVLIPGLWLERSSWNAVTPALTAAGHSAHPLTMPGVGTAASYSHHVGIADWVAAVTAVIDDLAGPVAVVGHSGGGNVAYGAADARPDRVACVIFVDTFPPATGAAIWQFPIVDGVVPFPGWSSFEEAEVADLDKHIRAHVAEWAQSVPARVPTDPLVLTDERRRDIPVTVVTSTVPSADIRGLMAEGPEWITELAAITDLQFIDLPGGHWPQFSQPEALGKAILDALPGPDTND